MSSEHVSSHNVAARSAPAGGALRVLPFALGGLISIPALSLLLPIGCRA